MQSIECFRSMSPIPGRSPVRAARPRTDLPLLGLSRQASHQFQQASNAWRHPAQQQAGEDAQKNRKHHQRRDAEQLRADSYPGKSL